MTAGLKALSALSAGRIDIEYRDARLTGALPTSEAELADAEAEFRAALPQGFAGTVAMQTEGPEVQAGLDRDRYWMHLARDPEGLALSGQVPDATTKQAIETQAAALYGNEHVDSALTVTGTSPPASWEAAALGALGHLHATIDGEADLTAQSVTLRGRVTEPERAREIHDGLLAELPGYSVNSLIRVDLPMALETVPLPPIRCAAELNRANRPPAIDFTTGSAVITVASAGTLDALAAVLRRCVGGAISVGGHTDAQGSDEVNERLSQARAEAVVRALVERGVPAEKLLPIGFGEERPIATNETAAGRARNRRIEFEPAG